jgi:hypothetical protein
MYVCEVCLFELLYFCFLGLEDILEYLLFWSWGRILIFVGDF